jgi:hypothetical protein
LPGIVGDGLCIVQDAAGGQTLHVCAPLMVGQMGSVNLVSGGFEGGPEGVERPASAEGAVHEHDG